MAPLRGVAKVAQIGIPIFCLEAINRGTFMFTISREIAGRTSFNAPNYVEMPEEAGGDRIPSTSRRTTRAHKHHVDNLPEL